MRFDPSERCNNVVNNSRCERKKLLDNSLCSKCIAQMAEVRMPGISPAESLAQQMDTEAAFNMRDWVQRALEAKGAKIVGAGVGCGGADLDFVVEGHKFNVFIAPR